MVIAAFKYVPQPTATTFAFSSLFVLLLWFIQKRRQKLSLLLRGQNCFNSLSRYLFCTWMIEGVGWNAPGRPGRIGWNHSILPIVLVQNSWHGKELKQFFPTSSSDDLCLPFCINPWTEEFCMNNKKSWKKYISQNCYPKIPKPI